MLVVMKLEVRFEERADMVVRFYVVPWCYEKARW